MTYNPYKRYQTDADLETKGVWFEEPDFRVRAARAGGRNVAFQRVTERVMRPVRRLQQTGNLSSEIAMEKTIEILAEASITEWQTRLKSLPKEYQERFKELAIESGNKTLYVPGIFDPMRDDIVPVTKESVMEALSHMPEFVAYLTGQITEAQFYRVHVEEDVKN